MLVSEEFVNEDEQCRFGCGEPYEPWTEDLGKLFRSYRKEFGRCTGKVYIDTDAGTKAIGWVFQKRARYEDCNDTYLQTCWVTLYKHWEQRVVIDREFIELPQ